MFIRARAAADSDAVYFYSHVSLVTVSRAMQHLVAVRTNGTIMRGRDQRQMTWAEVAVRW